MSSNKQVEKLRAKLYRELPKAHPLKEHLIDERDEYVKNLYIDMLCVIAQYDNEDSQFALNFIRRIMAGAEMNEPITEHIKNAMEITEERFGEFLRQCKEQELENIFVVDALIISCADGKPNQKQVEFISEISEALKMKKKTVEILGGLAAAILEQDSDKYHEVYDPIPKDDKNGLAGNIVCYLKEFAQGVLADSDDLYWVYYPQKTEYTFQEQDSMYFEERGINNRKTIIFENLIMKNQSIMVNDASSVILINCELGGIDAYSVRELTINGCEFDGNHNSANFYIISDETTVNINNSVFKNYSYDSRSYVYNNRLIYNGSNGGSKSVSVHVSSCRFINITTTSSYILFSSSPYTFVENSDFLNCSGKALFRNECKLTNNTYSNCCQVQSAYSY